jgi:hypothetical protein
VDDEKFLLALCKYRKLQNWAEACYSKPSCPLGGAPQFVTYTSNFLLDNAAKPSKKPRLTKGTHASKNAYMLVYYKKSEEQGQPPDAISSDIPVSIQERVAKDNVSFEEWCKEMVAMRVSNIN